MTTAQIFAGKQKGVKVTYKGRGGRTVKQTIVPNVVIAGAPQVVPTATSALRSSAPQTPRAVHAVQSSVQHVHLRRKK